MQVRGVAKPDESTAVKLRLPVTCRITMPCSQRRAAVFTGSAGVSPASSAARRDDSLEAPLEEKLTSSSFAPAGETPALPALSGGRLSRPMKLPGLSPRLSSKAIQA